MSCIKFCPIVSDPYNNPGSLLRDLAGAFCSLLLSVSFTALVEGFSVCTRVPSPRQSRSTRSPIRQPCRKGAQENCNELFCFLLYSLSSQNCLLVPLQGQRELRGPLALWAGGRSIFVSHIYRNHGISAACCNRSSPQISNCSRFSVRVGFQFQSGNITVISVCFPVPLEESASDSSGKPCHPQQFLAAVDFV